MGEQDAARLSQIRLLVIKYELCELAVVVIP
jgi:hypothetical protein